MVAEPDSSCRRQLHGFLSRADPLGAGARRREYPHNRSSRCALVCCGRPMQWSECAGDVRRSRIWAGGDHLTTYRQLSVGDPATEPCIPEKGRSETAAYSRREYDSLRRHLAIRGEVALRYVEQQSELPEQPTPLSEAASSSKGQHSPRRRA